LGNRVLYACEHGLIRGWPAPAQAEEKICLGPGGTIGKTLSSRGLGFRDKARGLNLRVDGRPIDCSKRSGTARRARVGGTDGCCGKGPTHRKGFTGGTAGSQDEFNQSRSHGGEGQKAGCFRRGVLLGGRLDPYLREKQRNGTMPTPNEGGAHR